MKKTIAITLGKSVKALRNTAKITQEELAQAIGVSPRSLQSIEAGDFLPSYETLFKISIHLKSNPSELLDDAWIAWSKEF